MKCENVNEAESDASGWVPTNPLSNLCRLRRVMFVFLFPHFYLTLCPNVCVFVRGGERISTQVKICFDILRICNFLKRKVKLKVDKGRQDRVKGSFRSDYTLSGNKKVRSGEVMQL